jgi:hypothetical protein
MSTTIALMLISVALIGSETEKSKGKTIDPRDMNAGLIIPDEGYCDQPYIIVNDDGSWTCVLTTGKKHEGSLGQHIVSTISNDKGKTWSKLVDIEPAAGPEASWVVPLKTDYGRIYVFYTYNGDRVSTLPGNKKRVRSDMLGWYSYKYSDDHGKSWSKQRYRIPMRVTACDRGNNWAGKVQIFWGIDKPKVSDGSVYFAFTKLARYMLDNGEGWVMKSDNLMSEKDPDKITWRMLPDGDHGLRHPNYGSVQEEHNLVPITKNSFYCVYRTTKGFPAVTLSQDAGLTWTKPTQMRYSPKGRIVRTPRACPKLWKCENGKYLFWFHNNSYSNFHARNPVWLIGGVEKEGTIHWSEPEILLYHNNPRTRGMSYPDLIEQEGRYWVTEAQKKDARVHEIDVKLLEGLWSQGKVKTVSKKGLLLTAGKKEIAAGSTALPKLDLAKTAGMTLDFWIELKDAAPGKVVADARDGKGRGIVILTGKKGTLRVELNDGKNKGSWDSDSELIKLGKLHHVAIVVDDAPRIISFIVDGAVCDGAGKRDFGWGRYKANLGDVTGSGTLKLAACLKNLRVYSRYLRTSEVVGNFNAGEMQ